MNDAERIAAVRDILERASVLRDLCRARGWAPEADKLAETAANAAIELAHLEARDR